MPGGIGLTTLQNVGPTPLSPAVVSAEDLPNVPPELQPLTTSGDPFGVRARPPCWVSEHTRVLGRPLSRWLAASARSRFAWSAAMAHPRAPSSSDSCAWRRRTAR